jgi:hypothetical protein
LVFRENVLGHESFEVAPRLIKAKIYNFIGVSRAKKGARLLYCGRIRINKMGI